VAKRATAFVCTDEQERVLQEKLDHDGRTTDRRRAFESG
jgi:hypothetical protein